MLRRLTAVFAVATLLTLSGCVHVTSVFQNATGDIQHAVDAIAHRKRVDPPVTLSVLGPVGVDVDVFAGSVTVEVDPALTEATVSLTRISTHGFGRVDEGKAALDDIETSVDLVQGELGQVIQVRASTTNVEPHFQNVRVRITAPEIEGLTVRTGDGSVNARNMYGKIDVRATDGKVRISSNRPLRRPIQIINDSGPIDLRMRAESTGAIDAEAVRGQVFHWVRYGHWRVGHGTDQDTLTATFNGGTNPIVLRAADGDVRIAVVEAPTTAGRWIID